MESGSDASAAFLSAIDPEGPLEAAILLKRSGMALGAWTRNEAAHDVLSVMAGTLIGSIDTMVEAMGCQSPQNVAVAAENCHMLASKIEPHGILILIAPQTVREDVLQEEAGRIAARLSAAAQEETEPRSPSGARPAPLLKR